MARKAILRGAGCAIVLLLGGRAAKALDSDNPRFRLVYDAPASCPDRDTFVRAIRARTPRPRLADEDDTSPAIALRVAIRTAPGSSSGRLDLREPDGTAETRNVTSRTCAEVTDALALVAAVMLDPDARTSEPSPPASAAPSSSAAPSASGAPSVSAAPSARMRRRPPPPVPPPHAKWRMSAGGEIGLRGGIGPAIAPSIGAFAELERTESRLTSSARLAIDLARTSSDLRDGSQTYEWYAATLRLCPAYLFLPYRFRVAPCGSVQLGGHRGTTSNVLNPTGSTDLWLAPAAGGTLDWAATSAVTLELQGGAVFPLRRTRYFLAPDTTIYAVPVVAGTLGLGVRVRFL